MEKNVIVLGFYKYVRIADPVALWESLLGACEQIGLKGKILLGVEGVNCFVAGTRVQVEEFKAFLASVPEMSDLYFKEDYASEVPYEKIDIRIRKEIVSFGVDVDLSNAGEHISPEEFLELYDGNGNLKDENIIVLDARNDYEYEVGRFKGAMHLDIENFREFPQAVEKIANKKDKKVVMYCTGGIRCEKASAYLREKGFKDVKQLNQGIINFGAVAPDTVWEGKCFVFDKRLVTPINEKDNSPITNCLHCKKSCDFYRNCRNVLCNKFYISCMDCKKETNGCCSVKCLEIFREQCEMKAVA